MGETRAGSFVKLPESYSKLNPVGGRIDAKQRGTGSKPSGLPKPFRPGSLLLIV